MYKYEQEYNKVVNESKQILNNAREQYKGMAKKYNEETLQAEAGSLIRNTNDKLLEVKRTFLEQAEEGLRANLDEIDKNRELAEQSKTTEETCISSSTS